MNLNDENFLNHLFCLLFSSLIISTSGYIGAYPDDQPQLIEAGLNVCLEIAIFLFMYSIGYIWGISQGFDKNMIEKTQVELIITAMLLIILASLGTILTGLNNQGLGLV